MEWLTPHTPIWLSEHPSFTSMVFSDRSPAHHAPIWSFMPGTSHTWKLLSRRSIRRWGLPDSMENEANIIGFLPPYVAPFGSILTNRFQFGYQLENSLIISHHGLFLAKNIGKHFF